ncbi:MAG: hypothetical protein D4R65_07325 [Verrucomicrobiaceae bacterium]|nr:MAG: hypothetical protein D4R65_07325 [Verrucomicrobiaceae bacterium]
MDSVIAPLLRKARPVEPVFAKLPLMDKAWLAPRALGMIVVIAAPVILELQFVNTGLVSREMV